MLLTLKIHFYFLTSTRPQQQAKNNLASIITTPARLQSAMLFLRLTAHGDSTILLSRLMKFPKKLLNKENRGCSTPSPSQNWLGLVLYLVRRRRDDPDKTNIPRYTKNGGGGMDGSWEMYWWRLPLFSASLKQTVVPPSSSAFLLFLCPPSEMERRGNGRRGQT